MTSKSIKNLCLLALFATIALTIFVIEAQIPVPVPIPGVKLGLANVITMIVLTKFRVRDALAVLLVRILLGTMFTGQVVSMIYSLCGGLLCFGAMAICIKIFKGKNLWFVSIIGAIFHNLGQIAAAIVVMQSVSVITYLPFLLVTGCITGLFTGFVAIWVIKHWPDVSRKKKMK